MKLKDPVTQFNQLLKRAARKGRPLPNAVALATADKNGKPSVRMMLLKGADRRGFRLFTNQASRKGRELKQNAHAALCFWWPELEEQVRVEGRIEKLSGREADRYFATRPRGSQIGAWASPQSAVLKSRAELLKRFREFEQKFKGKKVPRPPFWNGFLVRPECIEFWKGKKDRLHERCLYRREKSGWSVQILSP